MHSGLPDGPTDSLTGFLLRLGFIGFRVGLGVRG